MERFELPEGWEWRALRDVCIPVTNWNQRREPREAFRYIEISSIDNTQGVILEPRFVSGKMAPSRAKQIIRTGDVLFGTTRPYLKNIAVVTSLLDNEICSTGFCVLRPSNELVTTEWLFHACRSDLVIEQVIPGQEKSAYPAVNDSEVLEAVIPIPPLPEQNRLVARIEAFTERIEISRKVQREAINTASDYFDVLCQRTYRELLETSTAISLREAGSIIGGGTPSKSNPAFWEGDIPWIAPKDMKRWHIGESSFPITEAAIVQSAAHLILAPAVLFVVRGMILARTVPVAISTRSLAINQDMKAIVPRHGLSAEFLAYMLLGAQPELLSMVEIAGHGTRKLESDRWGSLPIPLPDSSKQTLIVQRLETMRCKADELTAVQRAAESDLAALMPAILAKAFRGEL